LPTPHKVANDLNLIVVSIKGGQKNPVTYLTSGGGFVMWLSDEEQKILDSARYDKEINISSVKPLTILCCILGFVLFAFGFYMSLEHSAYAGSVMGSGTMSWMYFWQNYEFLKFRKNTFSLLRKLSIKAYTDN
jgi:hypothetical protein